MQLRTFALLLLALPLAAVQSMAAPWTGTIPDNFGVQLKGGDMNVETLDRVKALGMKWVRRGCIWHSVETEKGVYDFSRYEAFVKLCQERGLKVITPISFNNKLYGHVKDEPARTAYAKYAAALASHFKGQDIHFEIWNEPNTKTFWGSHGKVGNSEAYAIEYTNLVKATIPAMRAADPDCVILAGSVSNMWTESYKWMDFCFAHGMLDTGFDVWSVHPYGLKSPEDYIEAYAHMREQMVKAGGKSDIRLMNSERGFPIGKAEGYAGGDAEMAYDYQAWHLVRQYLIDMLEGAEATIWYEWSGKEGFALHRTGEPTPAINACKELIRQLSGYRLEKRIPTGQPRDFILRFTNGKGGVKLVAWTAPPAMQSPDKATPHDVLIPLEAKGTLTAHDLYGKESKLEAEDSGVTVRLTGAPQYITAGE
jgi:hypothetical protein